MGNYTMLLLLALIEIDIHIHSLRCTMGDQQMPVTSLTLEKMGRHNMYTHWINTLRLEDGNSTQDR
jgi:hypothetical protein